MYILVLYTSINHAPNILSTVIKHLHVSFIISHQYYRIIIILVSPFLMHCQVLVSLAVVDEQCSVGLQGRQAGMRNNHL